MSNCNGNCRQGRDCDCGAAVEMTDLDELIARVDYLLNYFHADREPELQRIREILVSLRDAEKELPDIKGSYCDPECEGRCKQCPDIVIRELRAKAAALQVQNESLTRQIDHVIAAAGRCEDAEKRADSAESRVRELEAERDRLLAMLRELEDWADTEPALPEDEEIRKHHPVVNGSHKTYQEALRIVGARRSKGALVNIVNWLLQRAEKAETERDRLAAKVKRDNDLMNEAARGDGVALDFYLFKGKEQYRIRKLIPHLSEYKGAAKLCSDVVTACFVEINREATKP